MKLVVMDWNHRSYTHTQMDKGRHKYNVFMHMSYIFKFRLLGGPRNNDTIVTMGTQNAPSLVSKYHSLIKGTRASLRSDWFQCRGRDNAN